MKNCKACKYCTKDFDEFVCFHPNSGLGLYLKNATREFGHCGPKLISFEQHPLRNTDGSLKIA